MQENSNRFSWALGYESSRLPRLRWANWGLKNSQLLDDGMMVNRARPCMDTYACIFLQ